MRKLIIALLLLTACTKEPCSVGSIKCKGMECQCVELPDSVTPDGYVPACLPDGVSPDASND